VVFNYLILIKKIVVLNYLILIKKDCDGGGGGIIINIYIKK
jgi:hypothetical protein